MKYAIAIIFALVVAFVASSPINEVENERKIISFVTDFYNQLIAEPINTLSSALASMLVQITAGIAQNGIGKRGITDIAQHIGETVVDNLYNHANNFVQELVLELTLLLAHFGHGKRNLIDDYGLKIIEKIVYGTISATDFVLDKILGDPSKSGNKRELSNIAKEIGKDTSEALFKAVGKIIDTLFPDFMKNIPTFGKRGITETAQQLAQSIVDKLYGHANNVVQQLALQLTQILAQYGQGKRDLAQIGEKIEEKFREVYFKAVDSILELLHMNYNFNFGKRELWKSNPITDAIVLGYLALDQLVISPISELFGKKKVSMGWNQYGKRELVDVVNNIRFLLAVALARLKGERISFPMVGKRGTISNAAQNVVDKLQAQLDKFVQNVALSLTEILANIQINGILPVIGKKSTE